MPMTDRIARLVAWWRRIERDRRIILLVVAGLLVLLLILLVRGCETKKKVPPAPPCAGDACEEKAAPVGGRVETAVYPIVDGCWTFDFGPATSVRLHRDPRTGEIDARIYYAPASFPENVEWHDDPHAPDDWRELRFDAVWQPPVLTLVHPIETVEEWALFNEGRYPQGMEQVLEYRGDEAVHTVGSMAARVVEEGTALRYRITFREARPDDEEAGPVFVSHDPGLPGRRVAEVVMWPSTRVFHFDPEKGWRTVELPNVDAEHVFDEPAASGEVATGGYLRPILDGRAVAFETLRVTSTDASDEKDDRTIRRGAPIMMEAKAASHCPYAQETARFEIEPANFSAFGPDDEWRRFFVELVETAPGSGVFRTPEPVRIDVPVYAPFAGRDAQGRPREPLALRLKPAGAGSEFSGRRARTFTLRYETGS